MYVFIFMSGWHGDPDLGYRCQKSCIASVYLSVFISGDPDLGHRHQILRLQISGTDQTREAVLPLYVFNFISG